MAEKLSSFRMLQQQFQSFFFQKEVPFGMAMVRICLSATMLFEMGIRWPHVREIYSLDGAPSPIALNYGLHDFPTLLSGPWAVALYSLLLCLLFTLMIGWKTRISAVGVFLLFTYFTLIDSLSTLTKYSVISSHAFLLLSLSECGAVWSLDRLLELKRHGFERPLRLLGSGRAVEIWPQRLLQIFIAVVYFGAAITKLQTPSYFSGDQLRFWLLTNVNNWNPVGEIMSLQPALLVPMGYFAILWEMTMIFMVWRKTRLLYLAVGAFFHVMTTFMLGLYIFPLVCISIYFCFLTSADVQWCREFSARHAGWRQRTRWLTNLPGQLAYRLAKPLSVMGNLGFAAVLFGMTCLGLMTERAMNVYAAPTPSGRYALSPMPTEQAHRMLGSQLQIQEEDKLMSFDIGKYTLGGLVVETGNQYRQGTTIYAQANLIPPHGDLYLECNLYSSHGYKVDQSTGIATREHFRYTFPYWISETLEPGEYQLVLKFNNQEVARKTIQVIPGTSPQPVETAAR